MTVHCQRSERGAAATPAAGDETDCAKRTPRRNRRHLQRNRPPHRDVGALKLCTLHSALALSEMGCVSSTEHATLQQKCTELEASLQASATAAADNATQLKTANASLTEV